MEKKDSSETNSRISLFMKIGILKKFFIFLLLTTLVGLCCIFCLQVINWKRENIVIEIPFQDAEELPTSFNISKLASSSYNFSIIESPRELCDSSLDMLFAVTSAPKNLKARNAIRRTWGSVISADRYKVVFLVAAAKNQKINHLLKEENKSYNDLVQADFIDSYYNLSLKSILMLRWINESCYNASRFVVKADDDTFVNIPLLLLATKQWRSNFKKCIYGQLSVKSGPDRNPNSKWYVSTQQYSDPSYPDFVYGSMYLITANSIPVLYSAALNTSYLYLEDVFLTGIVAEKARVKRYNMPQILNVRGSIKECDYRKYVAFHYIPAPEMYRVWAVLNDGSISKCKGEPNVEIFEKAFINSADQSR